MLRAELPVHTTSTRCLLLFVTRLLLSGLVRGGTPSLGPCWTAQDLPVDGGIGWPRLASARPAQTARCCTLIQEMPLILE